LPPKPPSFNFETEVEKDMSRFGDLLGFQPGADVEMILLKGHLLIEEQLVAFIKSAVPNPDALKDTKLSFHQRLALSHALHHNPERFGYGWVWPSIKAVNTLRNKLAHTLESPELEKNMATFVDLIESNIPVPIVPGKGTEYEMAKIGVVLSILNMCLARLIRSELDSDFRRFEHVSTA
jgi:hypothetical protein